MNQRIVCRTPSRTNPGMRLARDVLRADGMVLLSAATELDADRLAHLHQRGIETIFVFEDDPRDADAVAHDAAVAEARVRHLFRGRSNAARDELAQSIYDYRRDSAAGR